MGFRPGQSGNPGGRPKIMIELRKLAQAHSKEAFEEIVRIMRDADKVGDRLAAAREVLKVAGAYVGLEAVESEDGQVHVTRCSTMSTEQLLELVKNGAQ